nr:RNA polymerase sigma-70 factor [Sphingobacterium humi]
MHFSEATHSPFAIFFFSLKKSLVLPPVHRLPLPVEPQSTTYDIDAALLRQVQEGDETAFNKLYRKYAPKLLTYCYSYTKNREISEEFVQEIFTSIWTRVQDLKIESSFQHYIFGAAKYRILSYMRSEKVREKYFNHFKLFLAQYEVYSTEEALNLTDLKKIILKELQTLPEKCSFAFYLSRFEQKSIDEIAIEMGISKRTVENYLTRALKHLRLALKDYAWLILLLYNS